LFLDQWFNVLYWNSGFSVVLETKWFYGAASYHGGFNVSDCTNFNVLFQIAAVLVCCFGLRPF